MIDLTSVVKEGLACCREVEAVRQVRNFYDLGAPQRLEEHTGYSTRVNFQGHLGFACSEGQYSAEQMLKQAMDQAASGPLVDFTLPRSGYKEGEFQPQNWSNAIARLRDTVRELRFALPVLLPERSFTITAQLVRDTFDIANRWETSHDERLAYIISLRSHQGLPILATHYSTSLPFNCESILHQLCWRHCNSLQVEMSEQDCVPAIFSPQAAGQFWQDFLSDIWVERHREPWQPLATNPVLSVYEDGTLPGALGTTRIDGEGMVRRRVPLLEKGQPCHSLRDVMGARLAKKEPLGTAVRDWGEQPHPGYSNICVQAGNQPLCTLCQEMQDGIWLDYLTPLPEPAPSGIFQRRANIAYLVKGGRPVARLPQVVVQGVYNDMLNRDFRGLGNSPQLFGRAQVPAMSIANLQIFARELAPQEEPIELPQLWW